MHYGAVELSSGRLSQTDAVFGALRNPDADRDVDIEDFTIMTEEFTGPGR